MIYKASRGRLTPLSAVPILFAALALAIGGLVLQPPFVQAEPPTTVGFNTHPFTQMGKGASSEADMNREFDLARNTGANVVRIDLSWSWIESQRDALSESDLNQVHLRNLDKIFGAAGRTGVRPILMLRATPCWATPAAARDLLTGKCKQDSFTYPPEDPGKYGEFAAFLANRYPGQIAGIEVWNEANLTAHFKGSAAQYVALVAAANKAVAGIPIVAGSLHNQGEYDYMRALYRAGLKGNYDIWSDHAYAGGAQGVVDEVKVVRAVQLEHGDTRPIWVTEFGWTTCKPDPIKELTSGYKCGGVSESAQAARLPEAFDLLGTLSYVGAATSYELRNRGTDAAEHEDNFGVLRRDFSPKPAYQSVRSALTR